MGKKSRLKRERRSSATAASFPFEYQLPQADEDFERSIAAVKVCLSAFDPADVLIALGISELWRPNRSSQVKHGLALAIALSMSVQDYTSVTRIDTFDRFQRFATELHSLLPSFSMLEDFIPEPDWGEVQVRTRDTFSPIFYGCSVERIPDFIEAFRLVHDDQQALRDMDVAIALQCHLIRNVSPEVAGSVGDVVAGHVEVPSEAFWDMCREALQSSCGAAWAQAGESSKDLVVELGDLRLPRTREEFGNRVMTGSVVPALIVRIGSACIPYHSGAQRVQ